MSPVLIVTYLLLWLRVSFDIIGTYLFLCISSRRKILSEKGALHFLKLSFKLNERQELD